MQVEPSKTGIDGDHLVQLASDKSQQGKALLSAAVVELFSDDAQIFSDSDHRIMSEIILQLMESVELSVKQAISERLSKQTDVPHDLILNFVNMEASVAIPILMNSAVLRDPDLLSVVMHKTMEHQMAVSMRTMIPPKVSKALAESEHDAVVRSLLENEGAQIDAETYEGLASRVTEDTVFNDAMVWRRDLPSSVADQLYRAVSGALRQELIERHGVDVETLDDAIEQAIPDMIAHLINDKASGANISDLVETAMREGVLGAVMLALLQSAQIARFTTWLATASGLGEELINRIMFKQGSECLAAIFTALGLDRDDFLSIFVFLREGRLGNKPSPADDVRQVADFYSRIDPDKAAQVLKSLQGSAGYFDEVKTSDIVKR